jgi:hypothetical protein
MIIIKYPFSLCFIWISPPGFFFLNKPTISSILISKMKIDENTIDIHLFTLVAMCGLFSSLLDLENWLRLIDVIVQKIGIKDPLPFMRRLVHHFLWYSEIICIRMMRVYLTGGINMTLSWECTFFRYAQ